MRTWRSVVVVLRDAGGQLHDDPILLNTLLGFDLVNQIAEFSVQWSAAASATGQVQRSVGPVGGVAGESTGPLMKGLLAEVPGTALLHQMALNDGNIRFFLHVSLSVNENDVVNFL